MWREHYNTSKGCKTVRPGTAGEGSVQLEDNKRKYVGLWY